MYGGYSTCNAGWVQASHLPTSGLRGNLGKQHGHCGAAYADTDAGDDAPDIQQRDVPRAGEHAANNVEKAKGKEERKGKK